MEMEGMGMEVRIGKGSLKVKIHSIRSEQNRNPSLNP